MQAAGYTVVVAGGDDLKRIHAEGDALRDAWVERMKKLGVDGNAALTMFKDEIAKVAAEK
ncbi:hypothetical protein [Neopusillimonas aromaticivorans]|uniref:hypothetical protein n=1 Tax=Neopusillimonas aromaticivorans TaxID=2979868 RepID=UPI002599D37A|nr:hypothetical protein [Neopusillimonas aromaticivorans]WJJ92539.1 hypothetical protein N7E01_09120 [Neopusillimonas aromaticivorans]